ncbi:hypothetical protein [Clostridioides sp. ZZV15-6598]|uniref:hypothetical protein n=1 Tax=Clostridioides sp. ZZV15-6598 TaxID=2811501 RepID=UPI001D118839|nr:hypothetical protein [Clostridioides sp. ZZV15-6598]
MRKYNKIKNERGAALVLVLVVVALLSIVGVTFSSQIANRIKSTKTTNEGIQAKYLAETCVENSVDKAYENLYSKLEKMDNELKSENQEKSISRSALRNISDTNSNNQDEENLPAERLGYMNNIKFYLNNAAPDLEKASIELKKLQGLNIFDDRDIEYIAENILSHRDSTLKICKTYTSGDISKINESILVGDIDSTTLLQAKLVNNDILLKMFLEGNKVENEHLNGTFSYTYKALDSISLAMQNMIEYRHTFHIDEPKVEISDGIPDSQQYYDLIQNPIINGKKYNWNDKWDTLENLLKLLPNQTEGFNALRVHLRNNVKKFEKLSDNISSGKKDTAEDFLEYKELLYEISDQCNQLKSKSYEKIPVKYDNMALITTFDYIQNELLAEIKCRLKELKPQEVDKTEEITIKIPFYKADYDMTKEEWPELKENGSGSELSLVVTGDKDGIKEVEVKDGQKNIIGLGVEENSNLKYKVEAIVNFNLNIDTNVLGDYDIKDKVSINHDISSYKKVN